MGTDIVETARIARLLEKDDAFAARILGPEELQEFQRRAVANAQRGIRYVATRFAAKEAFGKALGTGISAPMTFQNMQTLNHSSGQPYIKVTDTLADSLPDCRYHVSLSDETHYVVATVILEK
jgi:holo-[acyl-carrier protein] synthase